MNKCINTHAISLFVAIITQCIIIYNISDKQCENDATSASDIRAKVEEYAAAAESKGGLNRITVSTL